MQWVYCPRSHPPARRKTCYDEDIQCRGRYLHLDHTSDCIQKWILCVQESKCKSYYGNLRSIEPDRSRWLIASLRGRRLKDHRFKASLGYMRFLSEKNQPTNQSSKLKVYTNQLLSCHLYWPSFAQECSQNHKANYVSLHWNSVTLQSNSSDQAWCTLIFAYLGEYAHSIQLFAFWMQK